MPTLTPAHRTRMCAALTLAAGLCAALAAALLEPRRVIVTRPMLVMRRLGAGFHGYRIAHISDIHMGSGMTPSRLQTFVGQVNALHPDLIVITGDFITYRVPVTADALRPLRDLHAPDGVVAIAGNHDYRQPGGMAVIGEALGAAGITLLQNTVVTLRRGPDALHIAGLDDVSARRARLDLLLAALPPQGAALLLAHAPDIADVTAPTGRFDAQLSGHTHGGQIRLPFVSRFTLPTYGRRYPRGLGYVAGMPVYVNQGLGTVGLPLRLRAAPEITLLTLDSPWRA